MRVVEPAAPVVAWSEVDEHLKLDGDESQRAYVEALIAAATGNIDGPQGWLGRAIGVQTLEARFDTFETCGGGLTLPYPPHIDLVGLTWRDFNRTTVEGDPLDCELVGDTVYPVANAPWSGMHVGREALAIRYRAGYVDLPAAIRVAILLMVGDLFRNRTTVSIGLSATAVPMLASVEGLLAPFRVYR